MGSGPVPRIAQKLTSRRLRVAAFHSILDTGSFDNQLQHISRSFHVLGSGELKLVLKGEFIGKRPPLWLTFDDGDPSVVREGLPILQRYGLHATLFVCPGLIETVSDPWWKTVRTAMEGGWKGPFHSVADLKRIPDLQRRDIVDDALSFLGETSSEPLTRDDLDSWVSAGMTLGSHTWDHPCLHQCTLESQIDQIRRSDSWLVERQQIPMKMFAYPNGDWTEVAEVELKRLDYEAVCLFDHRLNEKHINPLRISRLRISAGDSIERTRAILSGAHSAMYRTISDKLEMSQ